jgi:hypothetical protein
LQALEALSPKQKHRHWLSHSYHAALYAYGSGQQWERMQATFDAIKAAGITPKAFTYDTLISAYAKGGQGEQLDAVLKVRLPHAPYVVLALFSPPLPRGVSRALRAAYDCCPAMDIRLQRRRV